MTESFAGKLCCPIDKRDLDMQVFLKDEDGDIIEALLTCTECNRYYPVIYGIPIMTPDEYRDKAIESSTLRKWGLQLESEKKDTFFLEKPEDKK